MITKQQAKIKHKMKHNRKRKMKCNRKNTIFFLVLLSSVLFLPTPLDSEQIEGVYSLEKNQLLVTMKLKDGQFAYLEFDHCGINNIYGIKQIGYNFGQDKQVMFSSTDWVGPYMGNKLGQADQQPQFTGGWHGSNGDGTGKPTATSKLVDIVVSKKGRARAYGQQYDNLKIIVENQIYPYNDTTVAIKELVMYQIEGNQINLSVEAKAEEAIEIKRYYGLQTQNSLWNQVEYYTEAGVKRVFLGRDSDAGKGEVCRKIRLLSDQHQFGLEVKLEQVNKGNFQNKSDDFFTAFSKSYGKTYFNLINGHSVVLDKDDSLNWSGYYRFLSIDYAANYSVRKPPVRCLMNRN